MRDESKRIQSTRPGGKFGKLAVAALAGILIISGSGVRVGAQEGIIDITHNVTPGNMPPIWVSISGLSGEALQILQFDLYVQGYNFTNSESAQYEITGSANGNFAARAVDRITKETKLSKSYSGGSLRRQVHAFVDDFVILTPYHTKGIAQTKFVFKNDTGAHSELYVADFDGFNAQAITQDSTIVAAPAWIPGHMGIYYTSYKYNHPDIFYHNLSTSARKVFANFGGSNMSPAPSPDGGKVAMILSKDGWTDLYVSNSDGSNLRRLTTSREDESSPCWSPDGRWICFAGKIRERRSLCKISPEGGQIIRIETSGVPNPTEPDWSPDGKWIVFTTMMSGFEICVVPASGEGKVTQLVAGEDASWAPNSRTVVFARRSGGRRTLSLLDVPTKQVKDIARISVPGSNSQPSWAK